MDEARSLAYRSVSKEVEAFLGRPKRLYIDGEWQDSAAGTSLSVIDPAIGQEVTTVPAGNAEDVDRAVKAARRAFEGGDWSGLHPAGRERLLLDLADLVERHGEEFAEIESIDNGKSVAFARMVDVSTASRYLRYMAGWATKIEGTTIQPSYPGIPTDRQFAYTLREPVGVCGLIIPWNFPLVMAVWKLAPALATGCTCVLKPAEETPLSALRLAELIEQAGFPKGVVNVVTGTGPDAGAPLVSHAQVDKVAFTGSTEVGKAIGKTCMQDLRRVSLELGGKSPVIILDDVDVETASAGAAQAIFFNQGQVCTAGSRLFVAEGLYDKVVNGVAEIARNMKIGPGWASDTELGPLVSDEQRSRVLDYIASGKDEGAEVLAGGEAFGDQGYYVKPTVLANVSPDMRVVREEIFGPVLAAQSFQDVDEIAELANQTAYGLSASIWSNDHSRIHQLTRKIKAGTVWVNCHNLVDPAMPFGGYKQSGIGREHGRAAIDQYTELKSVWAAY